MHTAIINNDEKKVQPIPNRRDFLQISTNMHRIFYENYNFGTHYTKTTPNLYNIWIRKYNLQAKKSSARKT